MTRKLPHFNPSSRRAGWLFCLFAWLLTYTGYAQNIPQTFGATGGEWRYFHPPPGGVLSRCLI